MSGLADAQLEWEESEARMGKPSRSFSEPPDSLRNNISCSGYHVRIVDMFGMSFQYLLMSFDIYADCAKIDLYPSMEIPISEAETSYTIALVRYGLMPFSPTTPSVAITTRTLEFYRVLRLRSPQQSVQPFVKVLCDIHGYAFKRYLSTQFSIAYDLYLAICSNIAVRVQEALG